ncbi:MAG: SIR2 family protein [Candidatus Thiodiazotropha sp.]
MLDNLDIEAQPEYYEDKPNIQKWLASSLSGGRLRLILGAGVSAACGLPDWKDLVKNIAAKKNVTPIGDNDPERSSWLLRKTFNNDRHEFAIAVQEALYDGYDYSLASLTTKRLLLALGALAMPSRRGSVSEIITFNFDDLLELYLKYLGFSVLSTTILPRWSERQDVEVLHIHGLLPSDNSATIPRNIVFTESDFDEVVGRSDIWRKKTVQILQSNICVFIGISGEDPNLRSILTEIKKTHVSSSTHPYWGIRFTSNEDDKRNDHFQDNGILPVIIEHKHIPDWLLAVSQLALVH